MSGVNHVVRVTARSPSPRPCAVCGGKFTPKRRSNAHTCSNRCRQQALRDRRRQALAALDARIDPAILLKWAGDDPHLALDLAIQEIQIRRGGKSLSHWLETHPGYTELVRRRALELGEEGKAA